MVESRKGAMLQHSALALSIMNRTAATTRTYLEVAISAIEDAEKQLITHEEAVEAVRRLSRGNHKYCTCHRVGTCKNCRLVCELGNKIIKSVEETNARRYLVAYESPFREVEIPPIEGQDDPDDIVMDDIDVDAVPLDSEQPSPIRRHIARDSCDDTDFTAEIASLVESISSAADSVIDDDNSEVIYAIIKALKAVLYCVFYDWPRCKSTSDLIIMMERLLSGIIPEKFWVETIRWVKKLCVTQVSAQDGGTDGKDFRADFVYKFANSEFLSQSKKFTFAILGIAFAFPFGKLMSQSNFKQVWDACNKHFANMDLLDAVVGFCTWFLSSAKAWLTGDRTLNEIFTDPTKASTFDARVANLPLFKARVAKNDPNYTLMAYYNETLSLKQSADRMMKNASKWDRAAIYKQVKTITEHFIHAEQMAQRDPIRMAPTCLLIAGPTGQGKTCVVPIVSYIIQTAYGKKPDASKIYTLQEGSDFWDDYRPGVEIIVHDDAANTALEFQNSIVSDTVVMVANNQPRKAIMADLSEKGLYAVSPDGYIVTTNKENLHATLTSVEPLSIMRRFHRHYAFRLKRDERWCEDGMLKAGVDPAVFRYDIWDIDIYKWIVDDNAPDRRYLKKHIIKTVGFEEFCHDVRETAEQCKFQQERLMKNVRDMQQASFCQHGILQSICTKPGCEVQVEQQDLTETLRRVWNANIVPHPGDDGFGVMCDAHPRNVAIRLRNEWVLAARKFTRNLNIVIGCSAYIQDVVRKPIEWWQWVCALAIALSNTAVVLTSMSVFMSVSWFTCLSALLLPSTYLIRAIPYVLSDNHRTIGQVCSEVVKRPQFKRNVKIIGATIAGMGLIATVYRIWRKSIESQGSVESRPIPDGVSDCRNVYKEQYIRPAERNQNCATMSAQQVVESFSKHAVFARFHEERDDDTQGAVSNVFPMESEHIIVPFHTLDKGYKWMTLFHGPSTQSNSKRLISIEGCWTRIGDTDLAILYSPTIADRKSFVDLLGDKCDYKSVGCRTFWVESEPQSHDKNDRTFVCNSACINVKSGAVRVDSPSMQYEGGFYQHVVPTKKGMCGAPIITDRASGPTLIGFHSAGRTGERDARYCALTRECYDQAKSKLHSNDVVAQCQVHERTDHAIALNFDSPNWQFRAGQRTANATTQYVAGEFEVLGSNTCQTRRLKSSVEKTDFSPLLEQRGFPREHEKPMNIGSWIPKNMWLTNSANPSHVPAPYVKEAKLDMIEKLKRSLDLKKLKATVSPLDHLSTINGVNGVKGCDPMKKTTSAGIPYTRPKREFMVPLDPVEDIAEPYDFTPEILDAIKQMEEQLAGGFRVYAPHRCNLKDEAVKIGKQKVRVFLGSSLPYLYLMRKYFLPMSMLMQKLPFLFEMAVGTNCFGTQWADIARHITKYSKKRIIAGDYKAYDQKMEILLTKAAFEIILWLCEQAGYDDRQLTVCRGLMTETIAGCYDLFGEWVGLTGGNPSGHAMTVIINGLVNLLYMRCVYYAVKPAEEGRLFHELVSLLTYGDDNIAGVSREAPWYTHTVVANKLTEWNMDYTMADKDAQSVDYISLDDASFLKRRFVWGEDGKCLAPLEESSIAKTLHTYLVSKTMEKSAQHAELLMNANREYWMYGRDVFERKRTMLMELGAETGILHHLKDSKLDTWDEVAEWYSEQ